MIVMWVVWILHQLGQFDIGENRSFQVDNASVTYGVRLFEGLSTNYWFI